MPKSSAGDQLRLGKTGIMFHELLNESFHIGNVVVWPKLDWQPTEGLNSEGQGLDDKVVVATSAWSDMEAPRCCLQPSSSTSRSHERPDREQNYYTWKLVRRG
jgi:hypothetical protein